MKASCGCGSGRLPGNAGFDDRTHADRARVFCGQGGGKPGARDQGLSAVPEGRDGKRVLATERRRRGIGDEPALGGQEAEGRADGQRHGAEGALRQDGRLGQSDRVGRHVRSRFVDAALGRASRRLGQAVAQGFGNAAEREGVRPSEGGVKPLPVPERFDDDGPVFFDGIEAVELRPDFLGRFQPPVFRQVLGGERQKRFERLRNVGVDVRLSLKGGTQKKPEHKEQRPQNGSGEAGRRVLYGLSCIHVF